MNLFNSIKNSLVHKKTFEVPDGYCPNCWGRQEYSGHFFETIHKEKIDLINLNEKKGWIQEYAAKHLTSIRLQEQGDDYICPKCSV